MSSVVEYPRIDHGQGPVGTTKLETNAHKCGKENKSHSQEDPLYHRLYTVRSLNIKINSSAHEFLLHFIIKEVWSFSPQGRTGER